MSQSLVLNLPEKFVNMLQVAIAENIAQMQALLDDDNTPEEKLFEIAYGNDIGILQIIQQDLANKNNRIEADFYQLCRSLDNLEMTLQRFGEPLANDEKVVMVFSATSWEQAMAIKHQFLGFEPYKPL